MPRKMLSPHLDSSVYFITFTTYGTRLHGDPRGSHERNRDDGLTYIVDPDEARERVERSRLIGPGFTLGADARRLIAETCTEVADFKGWTLHGINVRTNHVHIIVASSKAPEFVMNTLKSWATRRLRERGLAGPEQKVWTRHGSTRRLWREDDLLDALEYVVQGQGVDLGGTRVGRLE